MIAERTSGTLSHGTQWPALILHGLQDDARITDFGVIGFRLRLDGRMPRPRPQPTLAHYREHRVALSARLRRGMACAALLALTRRRGGGFGEGRRRSEVVIVFGMLHASASGA